MKPFPIKLVVITKKPSKLFINAKWPPQLEKYCSQTEGRSVYACVRREIRATHESPRDFRGILKSIRGGKFKACVCKQTLYYKTI